MANGIFKTRTVEQMTGFRAGLLRAWERRFGLLAPERTGGGHRLYTEDDVRVLLFVRSQLDAGRAIGEVAAKGRDAILVAAPPVPDGSDALSTDRVIPRLRPASFASELSEARSLLVDSAVAIDSEGVARALDQAFALVTPERAIDEVLQPAAHRIGELWEQGRCSVAGEHLASSAMQERVHRLLLHASTRVSSTAPEVLCGAFPGDHHTMSALVIAWRIARAGYRVTWLGGALPLDALAEAVARLEPAAVALSVTLPQRYEEARGELLRLLTSSEPLVAVGGQGAPDADAPLEAAGLALHPSSIVDLLRERGHWGALR